MIFSELTIQATIGLGIVWAIGVIFLVDRSLAKAQRLITNQVDKARIDVRDYLSITLKEHRNKAAEIVAQGLDQKLFLVQDQLQLALEDVVRAKEAQDVAEIANRAKSDFLSRISHEIRTPINGIIGSLGLINPDQLTSQQAEDLQRANISSERLLTVVNQVLDLSSAESNKIEFKQEAFGFIDTCLEAANNQKPLAEEKGINLLIEIPDLIQNNRIGDRQKIYQVLTNLISNAIKFTERGSIKLIVSNDFQDQVSLIVEDTGIGIAKDLWPDLFQPFNTASQGGKGSGLGLSICHTFIKGMGGTIDVDSQEGIGTTFTVKLPIPIVEPASQQDGKGSAPNDPIKILSVDDDPINRRVLERHLEQLGYQTDQAYNGQQAVQKSKQNQYDIIFMDLLMPGIDGFEACRQIRSIEAETFKQPALICAITASVVGDVEASCRQAGMDNYLSKPFTPDDLEMIIKDYLDE